MRRDVSPRKTQSRIAENRPSMMMPLEKTSRSPRFRNCSGRKRSRAIRLASLGKSANEVLAASTRIAAVDACTK